MTRAVIALLLVTAALVVMGILCRDRKAHAQDMGGRYQSCSPAWTSTMPLSHGGHVYQPIGSMVCLDLYNIPYLATYKDKDPNQPVMLSLAWMPVEQP